MRRWTLLLALLAGCEAPAKAPAPTTWATPPLPAAWTGVPAASIGRGQAPQLVAFAGLKDLALSSPHVWQVPGDGPPRAVVDGFVGNYQRRVELYELDSSRRVWSVERVCYRIFAVTAKAVVCREGALHEERADKVIAIDLATSAQTTLHLGAPLGDVRAVCGEDAREVYADDNGALVRFVDGQRGWSVPLGSIVGAACFGTSIVVTTETGVVALARETGKETGRIATGAGVWAARDPSERIEVATDAGIVRVARDLTGPREALEPIPLGRHIASHGELRLVSSSATTAVLLDRNGVRAYLPFAYEHGAIGSSTVLTGSSTLRSIVLPPRESRRLAIRRGPARYITVPAELRDLPAAALPVGPPIQAPGEWEPDELVIDGEALVVDVSKPDVVDDEGAVLRFDARARTWSQYGDDTRSLWNWRTHAGVVLRFTGDRMTVLDAKSAKARAELASDHGGPFPAASLDLGLVVTAERNRVVARVPAAEFAPAWSVDVHGSVVAIHAAGDGVVVELDDGDAYRIDARTGQPSVLGAIGGRWAVSGDRIVAGGPGGVIPAVGWPPAPVVPKEPKKAPKKKAPAPAKNDDDIPRPPRLVTPLAAPPNLPAAWQVSVFDLEGAVRARNDYALEPPVTPGARSPGAPLVLVGDRNKTALVVDPETGAPLQRVGLPADANRVFAFSLVVDGKPITGVMLANPLRVVLF